MKVYTVLNKIREAMDLPCIENITVKSKKDINTKKYEILTRQKGLE